MAPMAPHPKPDPARGVFETMLVLDGAPVALEAHLTRLAASLDALYDAELPPATRDLAAERASGLELGRLRLTFVPGADPDLVAEAGELDRSLHFPARPISLHPQQVSGGLGCHKWVDRSLLPDTPPGEAPLLVAGDEVLEAAWANVFASRNGALFTPPLDGRILPGVTRAAVIDLAREEGIEMVERPLALTALADADEVFLTNSTRGIEAVADVAGARTPRAGAMTGRLREALRSEWHPALASTPS